MIDNPHLLPALLGRAIRRRRKALDLTLVDVGERAGLSFKHIGEIERGHRGMSVDTLFRVAQALDVTATELVEGVEVSLIVAAHTNE